MEKPIEECGIQNEDGGKENGREEQEGRIRRNVRCRVSRNTRFVNIFVKNYYHILNIMYAENNIKFFPGEEDLLARLKCFKRGKVLPQLTLTFYSTQSHILTQVM